jgi:hypothetical protein
VHRDTGSSAFDRYHQLLRAQAPQERLEQANALSKAVRELAVAGLRTRHPDATPEEIRVRLTSSLCVRDLLGRAIGEGSAVRWADDLHQLRVRYSHSDTVRRCPAQSPPVQPGAPPSSPVPQK